MLLKQEHLICTGCLYLLPRTLFHTYRGNSLEQLFWGRVEIEYATAYYYFEQGSKCRRLIHQIKYRGKHELARLMGMIYGCELAKTNLFNKTEIIIPVPLHKRRELLRGYNQSECFGIGLAQSMGKELKTNILIRDMETQTQTRKSRIARWENVENSFSLTNSTIIENRHILLVDDVVTTGATLDACASELLKVKGVKISIATIAYA